MSDGIVWNGFTQEALDAAYNNMAAVPNSAQKLADWAHRSAALRDQQPDEINLPYGPLPANRVDIFRCGQALAPMLVFIHGGWWQRNSRQVFSCMAEGPMAAGLDVALIGYTLAPEARLTQIAAEIAAALDMIAAHQQAAGRPARVVLSGWSAGGHLTALSLGHRAVSAGLSISGVFDLEPIRHSYINDKLGLDEAEATAMSPVRQTPIGKPLTLAWGRDELPELQRQSRDYAAMGCGDALPLTGHDHFSILEELASGMGLLTAEAKRLAGT